MGGVISGVFRKYENQDIESLSPEEKELLPDSVKISWKDHLATFVSENALAVYIELAQAVLALLYLLNFTFYVYLTNFRPVAPDGNVREYVVYYLVQLGVEVGIFAFIVFFYVSKTLKHTMLGFMLIDYVFYPLSLVFSVLDVVFLFINGRGLLVYYGRVVQPEGIKFFGYVLLLKLVPSISVVRSFFRTRSIKAWQQIFFSLVLIFSYLVICALLILIFQNEWGTVADDLSAKVNFEDVLFIVVTVSQLQLFSQIQWWLPQIVIVISQFGAAVIIIQQATNIYSLLKKEGKKFFLQKILTSGIKDHVVIDVAKGISVHEISDFLREFFDATHGRHKHEKVYVILDSKVTEDEISAWKEMTQHAYFSQRVFIGKGNIMDFEYLRELNIIRCYAVFLLSNLTTTDPYGNDTVILSKLIAVKNFNASTNVFCHIIEPENRLLFLQSNAKCVACTKDLKTKILARSLICPGLPTFFSNLIYSCSLSIVKNRKVPHWLKEYTTGADRELYCVKMSPYFAVNKMKWTETVDLVFQVHGICLLGIVRRMNDDRKPIITPATPGVHRPVPLEKKPSVFLAKKDDNQEEEYREEVIINPTSDTVIRLSDKGILIADDIYKAHMISVFRCKDVKAKKSNQTVPLNGETVLEIEEDEPISKVDNGKSNVGKHPVIPSLLGRMPHVEEEIKVVKKSDAKNMLETMRKKRQVSRRRKGKSKKSSKKMEVATLTEEDIEELMKKMVSQGHLYDLVHQIEESGYDVESENQYFKHGKKFYEFRQIKKKEDEVPMIKTTKIDTGRGGMDSARRRVSNDLVMAPVVVFAEEKKSKVDEEFELFKIPNDKFDMNALEDHVIIMGELVEALTLVLILRANILSTKKTIVLFGPDQEDVQRDLFEKLKFFNNVYYFPGDDCTDPIALKNARIYKAFSVLYLRPDSEKASSGSIDIYDGECIRSRISLSAISRNVRKVSELVFRRNIKFFTDFTVNTIVSIAGGGQSAYEHIASSIILDNPIDNEFEKRYLLSIPVASGSVFSQSFLLRILCQSFYNNNLVDIVESLSGFSKSFNPVNTINIYKIPSIFEGMTFETLYRYYLNVRGVIVVGLYRKNYPEEIAETEKEKDLKNDSPENDPTAQTPNIVPEKEEVKEIAITIEENPEKKENSSEKGGKNGNPEKKNEKKDGKKKGLAPPKKGGKKRRGSVNMSKKKLPAYKPIKGKMQLSELDRQIKMIQGDIKKINKKKKSKKKVVKRRTKKKKEKEVVPQAFKGEINFFDGFYYVFTFPNKHSVIRKDDYMYVIGDLSMGELVYKKIPVNKTKFNGDIKKMDHYMKKIGTEIAKYLPRAPPKEKIGGIFSSSGALSQSFRRMLSPSRSSTGNLKALKLKGDRRGKAGEVEESELLLHKPVKPPKKKSDLQRKRSFSDSATVNLEKPLLHKDTKTTKIGDSKKKVPEKAEVPEKKQPKEIAKIKEDKKKGGNKSLPNKGMKKIQEDGKKTDTKKRTGLKLTAKGKKLGVRKGAKKRKSMDKRK